MELLIDPSVIYSIETRHSRRFRILAMVESYNPNNLEICVSQIPSLRSQFNAKNRSSQKITRFLLYYVDASSINIECTYPGSLIELEAICDSANLTSIPNTCPNIILYRILPVDPAGFSDTDSLEVLKQIARST